MINLKRSFFKFTYICYLLFIICYLSAINQFFIFLQFYLFVIQSKLDDQHLLIKVTIHACELIHFATIFTHPDICVTGQDAEFNPTLEHLSKNKEKLLSEAVINPFVDANASNISNFTSICSQSLYQCRNRESDIIVYLEVDQGNHLSELRKCIYNSNIKEKVVIITPHAISYPIINTQSLSNLFLPYVRIIPENYTIENIEEQNEFNIVKQNKQQKKIIGNEINEEENKECRIEQESSQQTEFLPITQNQKSTNPEQEDQDISSSRRKIMDYSTFSTLGIVLMFLVLTFILAISHKPIQSIQLKTSSSIIIPSNISHTSMSNNGEESQYVDQSGTNIYKNNIISKRFRQSDLLLHIIIITILICKFVYYLISDQLIHSQQSQHQQNKKNNKRIIIFLAYLMLMSQFHFLDTNADYIYLNNEGQDNQVNPSVDCVRDTDNVGPSCKFLQYGEPQLYINSDPGDYTIILTGTYTLNSAINLGKIGTVREIKSQQERKQLIINGDFIDELNTGKVIFNNINFNYLGSSLSVISQGGDNSNIEIIDCTVTNSQTNFRLISKQGNGQLNIEVFEFQEKTIQTRVVSIEHNATINDCLFQNIINTDDFEYPNYNDLIYIVVNQESDEVLISNCLFSNIQYDIGQGGVYRIVASNQAQVLIINSEFYQCQTDLGSTIYTSINSGSSVKIDGKCQFIQCGITTLQGGGSILADLDGENCLLIIGDGIKFDSCYSHQNNGGCIYASIRNGASLIFEGDCLFQNCSCYQISGGLRAWCITSGKLIKVAGLIEFDNCSSIEGSGGAAFFGLYDESTLEINKIICKDCKAIQGGGVNMQLGVSPHLIIKNQADFIRCESSRFAGGGLYIDCQEQDCDIQFLGVMNFIDCSASRGGGLVITSFASNQIIMSNQCKFLNCSSFDGDGGGILLNFYRHPFQVQITGNIVFEDCSCSGNGGGMYIYSNQQGQIQITGEMKFIDCIGSQGGGLSIYSFQIISVISSSIIFQNCTGTQGGGMYMFLSNIETEIQITGEISFDNCSSSYQGGGLYLEISKSQLSFENKLEFVNCKSRNGGAMYLSINFELQSSIEIKDIIIQECQALISTDYQYSQSGFGGGIFIAGTGVYDVSSKMLDFSKMKMYDNSADKAGQSLYVAMPNVIEWCRKGISGEYVKGNYSDIDSDESELEGIPVEYSNFNSLSQVNIIKDQRPLELWWRTIWHILNRNEGTIKGNNQPGCAEYSNPCYSINYALQQISFELGGILTSVIPEKRIGICEEGYDLTSPIQFNKSNTYTNIIKIMKQLYMTKYNMEGKAEIKIIKGGDTSNIENGHKGWILASGGIELKFYFIKFITDKSKLNIPIIYIEDQNTNLELDSVTFSDINLSPSDDPKGIIHVDVDNTELIISDCIFEDITIQGEGGSAIRIENDQENSFDATIEATQFNNINSTGEESGQGGSAIYAEIREDCSLIIDDSCEFNDCVIESGNGGAIYVDIDYSKNFQFKIKDASFRHNKALKHNSVEIPPSGYGGVIFLTGTGDYDVESDQIDLSGMKSDSNSADNGGNNVYIVMPQLEEFCQYDEGSLVKGDYDDKLSNLSDVEGIATNISTFIQFTPEQISQEQKSLQYYWTIIASLRTAKVVVDFRNVDEPFKYQLVGKNMKQGNLNAKIIEIGDKTSEGQILQQNQQNKEIIHINLYQIQKQSPFSILKSIISFNKNFTDNNQLRNELNEFIYPPLDQTTDPINIVDQQDEQLATFAMKDKQFLNYKQKQYGALISNDRRFFTGSDGIEGRTVLLEVEVVFDTEEKLTDPPQKSKFAWWIGLLIGLVVLAVIITIGCCFICYCCLWKKKNKDKDLNKKIKQIKDDFEIIKQTHKSNQTSNDVLERILNDSNELQRIRNNSELKLNQQKKQKELQSSMFTSSYDQSSSSSQSNLTSSSSSKLQIELKQFQFPSNSVQSLPISQLSLSSQNVQTTYSSTNDTEKFSDNYNSAQQQFALRHSTMNVQVNEMKQIQKESIEYQSNKSKESGNEQEMDRMNPQTKL